MRRCGIDVDVPTRMRLRVVLNRCGDVVMDRPYVYRGSEADAETERVGADTSVDLRKIGRRDSNVLCGVRECWILVDTGRARTVCNVRMGSRVDVVDGSRAHDRGDASPSDRPGTSVDVILTVSRDRRVSFRVRLRAGQIGLRRVRYRDEIDRAADANEHTELLTPIRPCKLVRPVMSAQSLKVASASMGDRTRLRAHVGDIRRCDKNVAKGVDVHFADGSMIVAL